MGTTTAPIPTTQVATSAVAPMPAFQVNDVVQVQSTIADLEYVGLLGYVAEVSGPTVKVAFYHAENVGENAFCIDRDFLASELYFVGRPNPELLPL